MEKRETESAPDLTRGKSLQAPSHLKAKYQDAKGQARNIKVQSLSRGGVCIEDSVCLPIGTCLRLFLNIKGKTVEAQGEVAWNAKTESSFLHGITFTFMEQKGREWLNTFVMDWAAEQIAQDLDFSGLTKGPTESTVERRLFARLRIPLRIEIGFNEDTLLIQTEIYDLSEGGLCLISNFEIRKDQELYLKLWLNDRQCISLTGSVKYCVKKTHDDRNVNFQGVEFTKITPEAAKELAQFLKKKRSELAAIEIAFDDIVGKTNHPQLP